MDDMVRLLDVPEVSQRLKVSTRTIRRRAASGELRSIRIGNRLLFRPADITDWIDRLAGAA